MAKNTRTQQNSPAQNRASNEENARLLGDPPRIVVVGDGWCALSCVAFLAQSGKRVAWLAGTGSHWHPPLPTLEAEVDALNPIGVWRALAECVGVTVGEVQPGSFLREFRNKAFREPHWVKAPEVEARRSVLEEELWAPEQVWVSPVEARFSLTLVELEEQIRARVLEKISATPSSASDETPWDVVRLNAPPVQSVDVVDGKVCSVTLGSGQVIPASQVIWADRWSALHEITGLPKPITFTRKRDPIGLLQAVLTHESPIAVGVQECFFATPARDSGENIDRHVWGYFSSDGKRSFWTLGLTPEEVEDNHEIAKKLRRIKATLDKMFAETSWLPQGKTSFLDTIVNEQVCFEENAVFGQGEAPHLPLELPKAEGAYFLTDGYGPGQAMLQVAGILSQRFSVSLESRRSNGEAERVDLPEVAEGTEVSVTSLER